MAPSRLRSRASKSITRILLLVENAAEGADFIHTQWEAAQSPGEKSGANRKKARPPRAGSRDRITKSPTPSIKREGSKSRSMSPPKRSKARPAPPAGDDSLADVPRGA
ncbi:uncharacterized protein B0H64DRAFT_411598 [Chaetomium fimeti]|uniref:Uncharacterized protein n=1 Tax=Chaetomium fimeti TaxID=1854472 RepID=A0AAE0H605_9PEZI|nr:hypothetical protein B0H64DRAFT_411598 [Chaetomium fimeti]